MTKEDVVYLPASVLYVQKLMNIDKAISINPKLIANISD